MKKKKIFSPGPRPVRGLSAPEMEQITEGLFKCRMFNLEESRTQTLKPPEKSGLISAGRILTFRGVPLRYVHLAGLSSQPGVIAVAAEHVDAVRALSVVNLELAVSAHTAGVVDFVDFRLTPGT